MARQGAVATGRYRMSREGQSSARGLQGMYILQENAGCQIYRPTWQGTRTIFRPFPGRNPENTAEWDPFRLSDEDRDFGDWIRRYDMAFSFGVPGITFVLKNPCDKALDDQQNPVWMLFRALTQAVKAGQGEQSWNPLIFGATGRAAPINAPKDGYIMQGILMEHKSQPQNPPKGCMMEHQPIVLLMSQSAGASLIDKLSEKDAEGNWVYNDLTDLDAGGFIQFHQAGTQTQYQQGGNAGGRQMGTNAVGGGPADSNRYEVEIRENYNGISPTFENVQEIAQAHVKPWDDIIRIPSTEEQVRMLCGAGIPASAIIYALGDVYGDFIPQHVYDQAKAQSSRTSVPFESTEAAPAASPMGPATPSPQQDPSLPATQEQPSQPVAAQPATPAEAPAATPMTGAPMTGAPMTGAPAAAAPAQGFDPPPTHADADRSKATTDALEKARQRAAGAATT